MRQAPPQDNGAAERAFLEGRVEEAALLWKTALADPRCDQRGALEFNLGLAATRLGHHAEALWHFRNAERALPAQPQVLAQRAAAESALGQPAGVADAQGLGVGTVWLLLVLATLLEITSVALLCSPRPRTRLRWMLLLLTALLGFGLGAYLLADHEQRTERVAVVLEETTMHQDPVLSAPSSGKLPPGMSVRVRAISDRWAHIVTPQGTGYVPRALLGLVD